MGVYGKWLQLVTIFKPNRWTTTLLIPIHKSYYNYKYAVTYIAIYENTSTHAAAYTAIYVAYYAATY